MIGIGAYRSGFWARNMIQASQRSCIAPSHVLFQSLRRGQEESWLSVDAQVQVWGPETPQ
jgi:hypothetical protein